jgi:Flp pilus assembly pilin Flp
MSPQMFQIAQMASLTVRTRIASAVARLSREELGQDVVEYGGVLVLIAAILAFLLTQTNLPSTIGNDISTVVSNIFGVKPAAPAKGG